MTPATRKRPSQSAAAKDHREAKSRAAVEAYDLAHPEEAEWRRLMRAPIVGDELVRLTDVYARLAADAPCLWWPNARSRAWIRCPILGEDRQFVYVWFGRGPVRVDQKTLKRLGFSICGVYTEFFYTDAGRASKDELDGVIGSFTAGPNGITRPAADVLQVLGLSHQYTKSDLQRVFRERAKVAHPDQGGSADAFRSLVHAYEAAMAWLDDHASRTQGER